MAEWITITSGALTAAINPHGAELSSLKDAAGRELMTDADPAYWTGRAPLLFPIVGRLNGDTLRSDGRNYQMDKHGFARHSRFDVAEAASDRAVFALTDSEATRAHYPFPFRLEIAFALMDATLVVEARIANPGDAPLPASFGFHPAFAWPLPYGRPREDHRVVFAADESGSIEQLDDGLIARACPSPLNGRTLPLTDALFADDALIWNPVQSQSAIYGTIEGPQLRIAFPDTPSLGIWTKPGAHFVCVEPWHGTADPVGFAGDLRDKPGIFIVPPGGDKRIRMSVELLGTA